MKTPLICFLISLISILEANAQTVTDIDGNVYHTVTIGTQVWMKENLSVTHYNDGVIIPNITNVAAWSNLTTGQILKKKLIENGRIRVFWCH